MESKQEPDNGIPVSIDCFLGSSEGLLNEQLLSAFDSVLKLILQLLRMRNREIDNNSLLTGCCSTAAAAAAGAAAVAAADDDVRGASARWKSLLCRR